MADAPTGQPPGGRPILPQIRASAVSQLICLGDLAYLSHAVVPRAWLCAMTRWYGRLLWATCGRRRRVVQHNLSTIPGLASTPDELSRATRAVFEYKQLRVLLMYLFPQMDLASVDRVWPIDGRQHLDAALTKNKGALLVMSHMNSIMDFVARDMLLRLGYDVRVAFPIERKPFLPTRFHHLVDRVLRPLPVPTNRDFYAQFNIRPIVRALGEGAIIGLTGDGWHSAGVTKVPFLGREVYFTTGAASISRAMGCPIVPLFVTGTPPDGMRIVIEAPIYPEKTADSDRDLQVMVRRYVDRLDYHVKQTPLVWEHWFEPRAMDTMAAMLDKTLRERYSFESGARD